MRLNGLSDGEYDKGDPTDKLAQLYAQGFQRHIQMTFDRPFGNMESTGDLFIRITFDTAHPEYLLSFGRHFRNRIRHLLPYI